MPFWSEDSKSKIRARCPSLNLIKTHKPPRLESHLGKKDEGERTPLETSFNGEFDKFAMDSCAGCSLSNKALAQGASVGCSCAHPPFSLYGAAPAWGKKCLLKLSQNLSKV